MTQENGHKTAGRAANALSSTMQVGSTTNSTTFKIGNPGGPGRPRGSRTRVDLPQMILNNAARAGFMTLDEKGKPIASGIDEELWPTSQNSASAVRQTDLPAPATRVVRLQVSH
jgi:hypothetical protein